MKIIYCDGIFDLFHHGHLQHIAKIHTLFDEHITLLVGVISDKVATEYKRMPKWNEFQRVSVLNACKYVTEAFITDILIMNEAFLEKYNIDYVVHGFTEEDKKKQSAFFEIPIRMGKFIEIDYHTGISTSQIISHETTSTKTHVPINVRIDYDFPVKVQEGDKVLIVGPYFGGNIGTKWGICLNNGCDRINHIFHYPNLCFPAQTQIFKPHYFDFVFCFDKDTNLQEFCNISKKGVFAVPSTKYNI